MYPLILFALASSLVKLIGATAPDPLAVTLVRQQFFNAHIPQDVLEGGFSPSALVNLSFGSVGQISTGQALTVRDVGSQPNVVVEKIFMNNAIKYTILMLDLSYPGSSNTSGYNLHWLSNNLVLGNDGTLSSGTVVIPYAGPNPPSGDGPHRYTVFLFQQPTTFVAPSSPKPNSGVQIFNLTSYMYASNIGYPIGGNYFTVEVGTATVSILPTTSVDPSTLTSTTEPLKTISTGKYHTTTTKGSGTALITSFGSVPGALSSIFLFVMFIFQVM
ncbi:phosphatidylethanolamine-binding protein [Cantharellus anzutake]|uniref:phosphatidylethanolamine-binding protein n=1 Tax=Cantharellus anzutake TaxID=1750568 RepID=UPI001906B98E|nr:phosphatidylethanolamine-binding protein [Cantharellus anzutake]KAF8337956.1 phosphatidylethanolamine-binding protein [Cantharellus anzutake]